MPNQTRVIGVIGARSPVGQCLLSNEVPHRADRNEQFVAFTRGDLPEEQNTGVPVRWRHLVDAPELPDQRETITDWICLAPIWVASEHFELLSEYGARRIVVLSSTSRFTKTESIDAGEQQTAQQLIEGEAALQNWAEAQQISWVILRPTLIYGFGRDKNIASVVRFIRRWKCFPLLGKAHGKRQPIHAADVATASLQALRTETVANQAYNISGAETLTYREMIERVFLALQLKPRFVRIPLLLFRAGIAVVRNLPRFRHLTAGMAERMNADLVFDHSEAQQDFGFQPRPFELQSDDVASP
ncbi:NAD-dependent epimerase/dehydratase family protein [Gimesia algae]|uniref:NAD dependent epimerase/dehydratase family protein n=1 Tax=Gimesia algae TaxID=2527971 RepID=A0A517VCQ2_9PLAN|nr:NAD-dependent epimerase/dehydratase family protein [Gimesia algae]QDT90778.1 NAD dependent epimerase/dehydratase family protein [Gimesia algae]